MPAFEQGGAVGRARRARDQRERDRQRQMVWIATSGVLLAVVAVAAVLVVRNRTPAVPGPATPSAADLAAPASLKIAANKIGFHPEPIPGVGKIEDKPASDAAPNANPDLLKPGTPAPPFSLKTPLGSTVSLSDFAGKALLLEFFATSCPHCQAEAPHLEALYRGLDRSRYAMASINADGEGAPSVFAFHRYFGLSYPVMLDTRGTPGSWHSPQPPGPVTIAYKIDSYPTWYVIAPNGTVSWASTSEQPTAKLMQELQRAAGGG
jgi:peroxiredoxin